GRARGEVPRFEGRGGAAGAQRAHPRSGGGSAGAATGSLRPGTHLLQRANEPAAGGAPLRADQLGRATAGAGDGAPGAERARARPHLEGRAHDRRPGRQRRDRAAARGGSDSVSNAGPHVLGVAAAACPSLDNEFSSVFPWIAPRAMMDFPSPLMDCPIYVLGLSSISSTRLALAPLQVEKVQERRSGQSKPGSSKTRKAALFRLTLGACIKSCASSAPSSARLRSCCLTNLSKPWMPRTVRFLLGSSPILPALAARCCSPATISPASGG